MRASPSFLAAIEAGKAKGAADARAGSGAGLAPVMPPAAVLNSYANMQLVAVHDINGDLIIELCPVGRMSRRLVLLTGEDMHATDISDPSWQGALRNRRGDTARDDDQAQIDIGDDRHEREREDRE